MLTINDLHNEQELSSFEMGKVAGGVSWLDNIIQIAIEDMVSSPGPLPVCGSPGTSARPICDPPDPI
jgi:hypothetical protein